MMDEFMLCILNTSVVVGVIIAAFSLFLSFGGKRYSAKCRKTIWILMAFCLLIPFRLMPVPKAYTAEIPNVVLRETYIPETGYAEDSTSQEDMGQSVSGEVMQAQSLSGVSRKEVTMADVLFVIWVCVGATMAACHLVGYRRMRRKIRRWGHDCEDTGIQKILAEICAQYQMKGLPELRILQNPATGPFTTGVLKNIIVLPDEVQNEKDMWFILKHEVLHCKKKDILWKLLFLSVTIIHWFNPLVWVLGRVAEQDMEIACDEEVVSCATREDRREYSDVIMSWIEKSRYKESAVSTGYVQGVRFLKRRFDSIINGGRKKRGILLIVAVCVFVLLTGNMIRITMQKEFTGTLPLALKDVKVIPNTVEHTSEKLLKDIIVPESDGSQTPEEIADPISGTMQELEGLMADFGQAYFSGDTDAIGEFLVNGYEWGIDVYESPDQADELEMVQIKGLQQIDEQHLANSYVLSIEFRIPSEDSLTYLTATWRKENEDWKISGYGLEK